MPTVKEMVIESLRWTTRDLNVIPDDGGWKRYEIIDGELLVTRAPHLLHQSVSMKLGTRLEIWSEETGLGITLATPGVIFSPSDAVIPDLVWVSHERRAKVDDGGHLTVAPELIVEIVSAGKVNAQRDKEVKLKLYSRHGVQEYWIVSWQLKTIEVYRQSRMKLELVSTLMIGDTITSPLLPGFSTAMDNIFL